TAHRVPVFGMLVFAVRVLLPDPLLAADLRPADEPANRQPQFPAVHAALTANHVDGARWRRLGLPQGLVSAWQPLLHVVAGDYPRGCALADRSDRTGKRGDLDRLSQWRVHLYGDAEGTARGSGEGHAARDRAVRCAGYRADCHRDRLSI